LAPGFTTVGMKVRIDHLQPSPVGARITTEATLERVEGRRLTFTVSG
jgi:fluoroacetyl-CoA thioesterase